jgi:hypothetical protein
MQQRYGLLILLAVFPADAFLPRHQRHAFASTTTYSSSSLDMVSGFGASSNKKNNKKKGGSSNNNKKDVKLKPRQQWDRYVDLKASDSVRVAVRIIDINIDSSEQQQQHQWIHVGAVKSKDNAYTEAAVIRHRVLIAEHARRISPLQISAKNKLEWAYSNNSSDSNTAQDKQEEEWVVAGKVENLPEDIDKLIGFEGVADPSGFYARSTEKLGYRSVADFDNMMKKGVVGHLDFQ